MTPLSGYTLPAAGLPIPFVVCDSDGRILRTGTVPDTATGDLQAQSGEHVFAGLVDLVTEYIDDVLGTPTATARPAHGITMDFLFGFGATPGSGKSVYLWDVPNGATIEVTDPAGILHTAVADGTQEDDVTPDTVTSVGLRLDLDGIHQITVRPWPALDFVSTFDSEF